MDWILIVTARIDFERWRKFCITFDNTRKRDYLSERLVVAWVSGCVPVYGGGYDVAAIAPGPRSFIDIRDFASAEALAEHLQYLDGNHSAYLEYFAWKQHGVSESFLRFTAMNICTAPCRVCHAVRDHYMDRK